jgi:hypothetical protein
MRYLIPLLAALALTACAGTPAQIATTAQTGLYAAATLARAGTIDEQLAPAYTRNAMVRQRAARQLDAGHIDIATARAVLTHTDAARTALDTARASAAPAVGAAYIALARQHITAAETLLETAP